MALLRPTLSTDMELVIQGAQVTLRAPQMADYMEWAELRGNSQAFLTPWEPTWLPDELSKNSYRRRVRYYHTEMRDDNGYALFIFRNNDQALLGGITLSNVRRGVMQSCTLGYWIGETHARQGYMAAALRTVLPYVFDTIALHRVEAACLPHNEASTRLLEKIGFIQEGLARRYLRINGVWQDHLLYALLRDDPRG